MKTCVKVLFLFLGTLFLALPSLADETVISKDFERDGISFKTFEGYDIIELDGCTLDGKVGTPALPVYETYVAIPGNMQAIDVEILNLEWEDLSGVYEIYPQQIPLRISGNEIHPFQINDDIFRSSRAYPEMNVELYHQADLAGVGLVSLSICPFIYYPLEGKLQFLSHIEFAVHYTEGWETKEDWGALDLDSAKRIENRVKGMVINPQDVSVRATRPKGDPTRDRDYVIISPSSYVSAWEPLRAWKEKKGLNAVTVTTDWVSSNYGSGANGIQSFVSWAVSNWGTEYFFLGGDTNLVSRHTRNLLGDNIPNDTYYADYDNDWVCEVAVGRGSVGSTSNAYNLGTKIINYEKNCPSTDFAQKAGLYGFDLDASTDGEDGCEHISGQYIPLNWTRSKVYDSHGGNHETNVKNSINAGQNLINHIDHCNYSIIGVGSSHGYYLSLSEISNFNNGADRPGIFNSIGCWPGAIDYDCCGERWIEDSNGGGWAALMNTRYGWYNPGTTSTLSCLLQRNFNRSIFDQGYYHCGYANNDSKNDFGASTTHKKYIFTEMSLLGDPETFIWTSNPVSLTILHETMIFAGYQGFTVNVKKSGANLSGALVCVQMDSDEVYDFGITNSSGNVTFVIWPNTEGTMYVTVTKAPDCDPYEGWVMVSAGSPEPPTISTVDPEVGPTSGGTLVTLTGSNFASLDSEVTFGGNPANNILVYTSTMLTCETPAHGADLVDVDITTSYGSDTLADCFDYLNYPPEILSITPDNGPRTGGNLVTVEGNYFIAGTNVQFGTHSAGGITVVDHNTITCLVPTGDDYGPIDVTVSNLYGSDSLANGYMYNYPPPEIYSLDPDSGATFGGTNVTIHGIYFTSSDDAVVTFGELTATDVNVLDYQTLTCSTPQQEAGVVDVGISTYNGSFNLVNGYTYYDLPGPEIFSVNPGTGPQTGGTLVTIQGANLDTMGDLTVAFGVFCADNITVLDSSTLTCTSPPYFTFGQVWITVMNFYGHSTLDDAFNYTNTGEPFISDVTPDYGHCLGGATLLNVTITGGNFTSTPDTIVTFGGFTASNVAVVNPSTITCTIPAHDAGIVAIGVINSLGTAEMPDCFTYMDRPILYFVGGTPAPGQLVGFEAVCPDRTGHGIMLVCNNILEQTWVGPPYSIWVDISLVGFRTLYQSITNSKPKLDNEGRRSFIVRYPNTGGPVDRFQLVIGTMSEGVDLDTSNYLDF